MSYALIALTVALTVYGQLVTKWRVDSVASPEHEGLGRRLSRMVALVVDPWILSGLAAALLGGFAWMAALTEISLSRAYPFIAATFVAVLLASAALFGERLTRAKLTGVALVVAGLVVGNL